jgi:multisubunit Na+/H+ antiporter MnhB subunit
MRINLSRKTFLWSTGIGAVLALLSLRFLQGGHDSIAGHFVWTLIYPFLTAADRVTTDVFFTHNRIAPSLLESLVVDVLFVVLIGCTVGLSSVGLSAAIGMMRRRQNQ